MRGEVHHGIITAGSTETLGDPESAAGKSQADSYKSKRMKQVTQETEGIQHTCNRGSWRWEWKRLSKLVFQENLPNVERLNLWIERECSE